MVYTYNSYQINKGDVMDTAKIFKNGRSQAVRIPKKYRFNTSKVSIRQQGESIILTPERDVSWNEFFKNHTCPDFELDRSDAQKIQEREQL